MLGWPQRDLAWLITTWLEVNVCIFSDLNWKELFSFLISHVSHNSNRFLEVKCFIRWFCCVNEIVCTYTNLNGVPRLYGIATIVYVAYHWPKLMMQLMTVIVNGLLVINTAQQMDHFQLLLKQHGMPHVNSDLGSSPYLSSVQVI